MIRRAGSIHVWTGPLCPDPGPRRGPKPAPLLFNAGGCGVSDVKNPPAMWETWVGPLGGEDLLEEEMATPSRIPAWRTPWIEEPGGLQSMGSQRVTTEPETLSLQHFTPL